MRNTGCFFLTASSFICCNLINCCNLFNLTQLNFTNNPHLTKQIETLFRLKAFWSMDFHMLCFVWRKKKVKLLYGTICDRKLRKVNVQLSYNTFSLPFYKKWNTLRKKQWHFHSFKGVVGMRSLCGSVTLSLILNFSVLKCLGVKWLLYNRAWKSVTINPCNSGFTFKP